MSTDKRPVGSKENYFIHDGYTPRLDFKHFDDTPFKDEYQDEVYAYARKLYNQHFFGLGLTEMPVVDVGCGSGYKLMKYFSDVETIGIDLDPAYSFVQKQYPERKWMLADLKTPPDVWPLPSVVICADVIEHLADPNQLLSYIDRMVPNMVVFSTPDRDTLTFKTEDGPPRNEHHVREWNLAQFAALIGEYFEVAEHFVDGSQIVLALPKTDNYF